MNSDSMSKKWSDFVQKQKPQMNQSEYQPLTSIRQTRTSTSDLEQSNNYSMSAQLERARNFVLGRPEPEPQGPFISCFNCLPNEKSYGYAALCFLGACLLFFGCFMCIPTLVLNPSSFVMCFTFSMISLIVAMAFLNGPRVYCKKLFLQKNLIASVVLISSILLALWFSFFQPKYIWSIIFCVMELNAVMFYFCNSTPISWERIKWVCSAGANAVKSKF